MKIVVVSDNHGDKKVLEKILNSYPDYDGFIHCGDSEMDRDELVGYASVRGNNDDDFNYPAELVLVFGNHRILVVHGHRQVYLDSRYGLVEKAKENNCDIVCYGHTHAFEYQVLEGVTLLNPGSLNHNRDGSRASYAILELDDDNVMVEKKVV